MKKGLPIILIFLALAHVAGIMPFYFYILDEIRGEMSIELSHQSALQKILVTTAEYNNPSIFHKTGDGEFLFKGQMYDFKSAVKYDKGYVFYGISDNKETNLVGLLESIFEQADSHSKHSLPFNNLLKNFSADFVIPAVKDFTFFIPGKMSFTYLRLIALVLPGHLSSVSVPPDFS